MAYLATNFKKSKKDEKCSEVVRKVHDDFTAQFNKQKIQFIHLNLIRHFNLSDVHSSNKLSEDV